MFNVTFRNGEKFQELFAANATKIMGDIPNFTDIAPVLQIGEVVLDK